MGFGRDPLHQEHQLVPSHGTESVGTYKGFVGEAAGLKALVVHHIPTSFPMQQFHRLSGAAHECVDAAIGRSKPLFINMTAHTVDAQPHVDWRVKQQNLIAFVLTKHNYTL